MLTMRQPTREIPGLVTGLHDLCRYVVTHLTDHNLPLIMWELGSYNGESADIFAQYFSVVHCVDPWDDGPECRDNSEPEGHFDRMAAKHPKTIIKHKDFSEHLVSIVEDNDVSFVYVDAGDHSYERAVMDISLWWSKVRPGGILGGHDLQPKFHGVEKALGWLLYHNDDVTDLRLYADTSFTVRKNTV